MVVDGCLHILQHACVSALLVRCSKMCGVGLVVEHGAGIGWVYDVLACFLFLNDCI